MVRAASFRRKLAVLFIAALMLSVLATAALAVEYPSKPNSYVADYANVLTAAERTQLEGILNDVQAKTTCEVAFVTLKDVGNVTVEEYRVKLFEKWGIGKAGKDNGLLVLLVTGSRDIQFEVGYGLEPIITDSLGSSYLDQYAVPSLRENKYGAGLINLANAFAQRLISKYDPANPPTSSGAVGGALSSLSPVAAVGLLVIPFVLIIGGIVFAARAFAPKCPVCKSRVHVRDRVITPATTLIAGKGMRISTCPKCGHVNEREYTIPRIIPVIIPPRGGGHGGGGFGGGFGGGKGGGFGGFGGFGGGRSGGGGGGRKF